MVGWCFYRRRPFDGGSRPHYECIRRGKTAWRMYEENDDADQNEHDHESRDNSTGNGGERIVESSACVELALFVVEPRFHTGGEIVVAQFHPSLAAGRFLAEQEIPIELGEDGIRAFAFSCAHRLVKPG